MLKETPCTILQATKVFGVSFYLFSTLISFSKESSLPRRAFLSMILIACICPSSFDSASLTCENAPLEKNTCVKFCGIVKFCETHLCFVASSWFVFGQRRYIRWWDYNYQAGPQIGTIDAEKASWCITTLGILWPNGLPYLAPFEKMQTCGLFQNVHLQLLGHENCEKPSHKQKMPKPALFPRPFLPFSGNVRHHTCKKYLCKPYSWIVQRIEKQRSSPYVNLTWEPGHY